MASESGEERDTYYLETMAFACKSAKMALHDMTSFIEVGDYAKAAWVCSSLYEELERLGKVLTFAGLRDQAEELAKMLRDGWVPPYKENPELVAENERLLATYQGLTDASSSNPS